MKKYKISGFITLHPRDKDELVVEAPSETEAIIKYTDELITKLSIDSSCIVCEEIK